MKTGIKVTLVGLGAFVFGHAVGRRRGWRDAQRVRLLAGKSETKRRRPSWKRK